MSSQGELVHRNHQIELWGHWYPCLGLLVTYALGFKARVGPLLVCFIMCSDSPLVEDLLTSWAFLIHILADMYASIGGPRTRDRVDSTVYADAVPKESNVKRMAPKLVNWSRFVVVILVYYSNKLCSYQYLRMQQTRTKTIVSITTTNTAHENKDNGNRWNWESKYQKCWTLIGLVLLDLLKGYYNQQTYLLRNETKAFDRTCCSH